MISLPRPRFWPAAAFIALICAALLIGAGSASAQEEGPACPADIDGHVLGAELPSGGEVQGVRCRYEPADNRSLVRLTARYNAPGDEPSLANGCGAPERRNDVEDENEINGIVFSSVGMARATWVIGNTNRDFNEEAVVAAARDFLTTFEDLAIACPEPDAGSSGDVAEECAEEVDGLTARIRSDIENRDDVAGVRCFYAGTDTRSELQFVASLNPPGAEPTFAAGCGAEPREADDNGALSGTVFSGNTMSRVRYVIVDTTLEFDAELVVAEAAALLSRIEVQAQACDGSPPPTTAPGTTLPPTTDPGTATTVPSETTAPDTSVVDTTVAPVAGGEGADDDASGLLVPLIVGSLVVAGGAGGFVLWRRRQLADAAPEPPAPAPAPAPPTTRKPPPPGADPGTTIDGAPPPG